MSEPADRAPLAPKHNGVPLVGSAVTFARDPYELYQRLGETGDVVRFSMGTYDMATVLHPDGIRQVLVEDDAAYEKPDGPGVDVLSDGLLLTDGDRWQRQRSRLQPLFYRERVATYAETMATYAAAAADEWATSDAVPVEDVASRYTLRVLGKTLLGAETADQHAAVRAGAEAIRERTSENPVAVSVPDWLPTPANLRYRRGIERLDGVVEELLADADDSGKDLLSLLVAASEDDPDGPSEAEVRSQVVTFLFAGHETTATALTWALYELGRNPAVASRLQAEVDAVVDSGRATLGDLPALSYTEQVVREVLRRYPPASAVFRETREPVVVDGSRLPEGTFVTLPQFHVHIDERWWDDPMTFDPSRWDDITDPPGDGRPEYAYFPFGGGPRHCIGMRFARMELRLALATIAARTTVNHDHDGVGVDIGSTTRPEETVRATFETR
ncbi:cytochrome P450 [Halobacterium jilantaiense]|uniref:Cytochrome P450 n=1 Tax=Halobacterium jilantaiense TaxID=355548 RepID=A0A1I0QNL9_9EURY|nr:cytochrome P450 [Halobacterium jilantaiense]SEW29004.1 Cytochrome P450 [Halobacterium jilantaiense]